MIKYSCEAVRPKTPAAFSQRRMVGLRLGVPQLVSFGSPGMLLGDARLVRGELGQAKP